ncbi:PAS domain-containing protein [Phormidium tenue FACHB-886]|nr:PAS domain-containing protein [Phormidium tenue FACHB-886]
MSNFDHDPQFEALLDYIKRNRGFDFTGYKRSSLMRRVNKRMQTVEIEGYSNYLDYLEVHPEEFQNLFNTLLINVTSFFRDRPVWDYVISDILPQIVARKGAEEKIRVWSVGCASGQEAYTLAMALAEVIGIERLRERVKIYATDLDEEALFYARQASYLPREVDPIPPEMLELYFERSETHYTFRKDLRRSVVFGRHDLIQDAPLSKIDLLVCRNTLMYFNAETQARILARFHFALQDGGFLFLGKAEMLLTHADTFTPVDLKLRIFTKVTTMNLRERLMSMGQIDNEDSAHYLSTSAQVRLREAAFDSSPVARIVVDANGLLAIANERARSLFGLMPRDVGRPLQDLEFSYRPVELRSCIEQAYRDSRPVTIRDVEWQNSQGDLSFLDVQVTPLNDPAGTLLGAGITFTDVSRYKRLQDELEHSNQELEMAYEELQSTNEELETTNEELQSTNEELETTNEELQSTNEELETMNEELQSINEELQSVNEELQRRSSELNQSNAFLESILTSLKGSVVVVNRDLQVQIWNYKAEDLWGLRASEAISQNFLNLDIGLPVEQLRPSIRNCLSNSSVGSFELSLSAINRRGRTIQCRVTCTPLLNLSSDREVQGVLMLMEEEE